jgi:hypothetical protein
MPQATDGGTFCIRQEGRVTMHSASMSADSPLELIRSHAKKWTEENPDQPLNFYALVDAAQDRTIWQRLRRQSQQVEALLRNQGSAADAVSPHLIALGPVLALAPEVQSTLAARHPTAAFTLLSSSLPEADLHSHLARFTDVRLQGDLDMVIAFWDPAILGTLVGQPDDDTLHVPGPVLDANQLAAFLAPVVAWWYCDRASRWHRIGSPATQGNPGLTGFAFTQAQEDLLVEASVPDQVLYHLELNQPNLFDAAHSNTVRYGFIKAVLGPARQLGLTGMRDLVNFTALCLIYRRRMQTDPDIVRLLDQVQRKILTLDQALALMPA